MKAAEAMRRVIEGDDQALATGLATSLATNGVAKDVSTPLTSAFVGRPGLEPGTLGPAQEGSTPSVTIRLRSSEAMSSSLSIAEVLPRAVDWLQVWLHEHPGMIAELAIVDEPGGKLEVRLTEPPAPEA